MNALHCRFVTRSDWKRKPCDAMPAPQSPYSGCQPVTRRHRRATVRMTTWSTMDESRCLGSVLPGLATLRVRLDILQRLLPRDPAEGQGAQDGGRARILVEVQAGRLTRSVEAWDGHLIGTEHLCALVGADATEGKDDGAHDWIGQIRRLVDGARPVGLAWDEIGVGGQAICLKGGEATCVVRCRRIERRDRLDQSVGVDAETLGQACDRLRLHGCLIRQ